MIQQVIEVLKAKVLCRFIELFRHFPLICFKLCFDLNVSGLLYGNLFFALFLRGNVGISSMFYRSGV